jgi:Flp pilus assembly protein TadB
MRAGAVHATRWRRLDAAVERQLARFRSVRADERELAELLRATAAAARSGSTLVQSLDGASRRTEGRYALRLRDACARIRMGESVIDALAWWAGATASPTLDVFREIVAIHHRHGGDIAAPCHRLASLVHERTRLDAEARTATAQARFSARAVIAIPGLLLLLAAWRAPERVRAMLEPGALLLALPGIVLIIAGATVASRVSRRAMHATDGDGPPPERAPMRAAVRRIAGSGARSQQSLRLVLAAAFPASFAMTSGRAGAVTGAVLLGVAVAWPWSEVARARSRNAAIASSGIETLLEVSIALFAAGATAHEVVTIAPVSCPVQLRAALAPAVHGVGLGRTISSAFRSLPVVQASPILDGWLHAVCSTAELGSRSVPILDQLLRDARMERRERLRTAAQTAAPRMQLALVLLVVPGVMWLMLLATVGGLLEQLRTAGVA